MAERKRGVATNSILLSFVQCLTIMTSIVQTMILSRELTELEYGTYSQGLLVANFLVPFLLVGLSNAITYFSGQREINVHQYINTIVTIILILGLTGAAGIFVFKGFIIGYFGNDALEGVLPFVAFLPLLLNLITVYQTLFIAEDMAVSVAIRNAIVAVVQIGIILAGVFLFQDIRAIFILLIVMDVLQIVIFATVFSKRRYTVRIGRIDREITRNIFKYSVPLAFSTAIGTLSIYMDKLLIGNLMSVEDFALYTNMAKELPFSFIVSSFTTVITPVFIRLHATGEDDQLKRYWAKYLELGICITWVLCGTAIACSKDLLLFLYSEKYASGIRVFVVYLLVEMCRFSYFGIILSSFGKTKIILYSSIIALVSNFILNIILFRLLGMVGPAIASLLSILMMELLQIGFSCKMLKCRWREIFNCCFLIMLLAETVAIGSVIFYFGSKLQINSTIRLILCGGCMAGVLGLLNFKRIKNLIRTINSL